MNSLKKLDTKVLSDVIKDFGKVNRIFQSEAQFQFDLAWKLHKHFPNCQVKFEDMRAVVKDANGVLKKKFYTDIVMEQEDYSVAIELKYKTDDYSDMGKGIYLFEHGAVDLGRYDYLWDVHRVELLMGKGNIGDVEFLPNKKRCDRGFAVLLTNEEKYWGKSYSDKIHTMDHQFKFGINTPQLFSKDLYWEQTKKGNYPPPTINGTFRNQRIQLSKRYDYKWMDYCNVQQKNGIFKFVIIEVIK